MIPGLLLQDGVERGHGIWATHSPVVTNSLIHLVLGFLMSSCQGSSFPLFPRGADGGPRGRRLLRRPRMKQRAGEKEVGQSLDVTGFQGT